MATLGAQPLEPPAYGLVNSKTLVAENGRWEGGFEQESVACNARVRLLDICSTTASASAVEPQGGGSIPEFKPFAVQATVTCSTMGGSSVDWEQRARDAIEACQSKAVELEFWEGRLTNSAATESGDPQYQLNRYLTDGSAVDVTPGAGGAVKPKWGLAALEQALADSGCGTRGYIHVPVAVASALGLKDMDGDGVLQTKLGNYVVVGAGYTGTGPNGQTPGASEYWMYATGPVYVRLGDVSATPGERSQSVNTSNNTFEVSAERPAAVVFDGCEHFAVLVDLALDYA